MSSDLPTLDPEDEDDLGDEEFDDLLANAIDRHGSEAIAVEGMDGLKQVLNRLDGIQNGEESPTDSVLPEFDPGDEDDDRLQPTRPALQQLNEQQLEALREFRNQGIEHRPALLRWLLRLQYRTLGRLPDYWYHHIATDPSALACVLTGPYRGVYGARNKTNISLREARGARRRLVAKYLRPACREAFRFLRPKATEYLDDEKDPEKMAALAMRPALDEHYQRQEDALAEFWRGFETEDELDEWLHKLDNATFGSIKAVEPDFDWLLVTDAAAPQLYLSDEQRYVEARERIIARYLLPATNVSVRELAERAGESDDTTSEHSGGVEV